MKPLDFVNQLRSEIIDDNINIYKELFSSTDVDSASDEYWIAALRFFNKLDANEKQVFFKIIRQIEVDTVSNVLGVLDGVSWLENQDEDFRLVTESKNEPINGDLQDIFLEMEG